MNRLAVFTFVFVAIPAASPAQQPQPGPRSSPIPEAELVRRLKKSVDSLAGRGEFSGVVVLAKDGVPVYQSAHGFADRERKIPNNIETAFN
ncbi:MAG TPA: hypothetical protein VGD02_05160, partial [Gemmatimonadaceae bacterium]